MWLVYSFAASLFWSIGQIFLKKGYSKVSPLWTVIVDVPVYIVIFMAYSYFRIPDFSIEIIDFLLIFLISVLYIFYFYGLEKGELSISATIISVYPAVTIVLAGLFLHEELTLWQILMTVLILLGALILSVKIGGGTKRNIGKAAIVIPIFTALCIGIGDFLAKFAIDGMGADKYIFYLPVANIFAASLFWIADKKGRKITKGLTLKSFKFNILGTTLMTLGLLAFSVALSYGQASLVAPVSGSYMALTLVLAYLFLGERLTRNQVLGAVLTIIGVMFIAV